MNISNLSKSKQGKAELSIEKDKLLYSQTRIQTCKPFFFFQRIFFVLF